MIVKGAMWFGAKLALAKLQAQSSPATAVYHHRRWYTDRRTLLERFEFANSVCHLFGVS